MTDTHLRDLPLKDDEPRSGANLVGLVKVLQKLLKEEKAITPITRADRDLFLRFFSIEAHPQYGKSWAYLTQAVNGHRLGYPLGLKYHFNDILIPIGYFPRPATNELTWHFHLVRPMGDWTAGSQFLRLCQSLRELSGTHVYVKKLIVEERNLLQASTGFKPIREYPWHALAIEEDDTFEEVVLDTNQTLRLLETIGSNQVKDHYRRFIKRYVNVEWKEYGADLHAVAWSIVQQFFRHLSARRAHLSVPEDYLNMISSLPLGSNGVDYFAYLLYIEGQPAGFCLAERLCESTCAGVYANIALREDFPYSSEFLIVELIRKLQLAGINTVNLGGSETNGLHDFKMKFRPIKQEKMHWIIYE